MVDEKNVVDEFNIENTYVKGLVKYIENVATPFSMSIEGDWGSGKTTIMQLVKKSLKDECKFVEFNAWKYSQICEEKFLPFYFIKAIEKELGINNSQSIVKKLASAGTRLLSLTVSRHLDKLVIEKTNNLLSFQEIANEINNVLSIDKINDIESIKNDFSKKISSKISDNGRLIVFVDDLDRITPKAAIDVLDLVKNFIDCDKCVFIFATDMEVVRLGLKAKYGEAFVSKKRQENYFDKIMRITYKVPVMHYDYKTYLSKRIKIKQSENNMDILISVIDSTIGRNPRTINKIYDTYELFINIHNNVTEDIDKIVLFSMLCLQNNNTKFYNYLIDNYESIIEKIDEIKHINTSINDSKVLGYDATNDEMNNIIKWFDSFNDFVAFKDSFDKVIKIDRKDRKINDYGSLGSVKNISTIIALELKKRIKNDSRIKTIEYKNNNLCFSTELLNKKLPEQKEEFGFWDDKYKNRFSYLCFFDIGHGKITYLVDAKLRGLDDKTKLNLEEIYKIRHKDELFNDKSKDRKMCTLYSDYEIANKIVDEDDLKKWVNNCINNYLNWENENIKEQS